MAESTCHFTLGGHDLELRVSDRVFKPVSTTQKFAELVTIPKGAAVLDLGCGVGPLTIASALNGAGHVTAVDIVPEAVELARANVAAAGVADKVTLHCGDLYAPVAGQTFDVIVNDVSGIAELAARASRWYPENIPTGGEDGADVVLRVLDEAPQYMNPGGVLFFATASLSNAAKIMAYAEKRYGDKVALLKSFRFPFSPELEESLPQLEALREQGKIDFESRRSRHLWNLNVYRVAVG